MPTETMGTKKSPDQKDAGRKQRQTRRQQRQSRRLSSDIKLKACEQELVLGVSHHDDLRIKSFNRALLSKETPHIFAYYHGGRYIIKKSHIPNLSTIITEAHLSLAAGAAASSEISLTGQTLAEDEFITLIQAIKKNRSELGHNAGILACIEANLGYIGEDDTRKMSALVEAIGPKNTTVFSANEDCLQKVETENPHFSRADSSIKAAKTIREKLSSSTTTARAASTTAAAASTTAAAAAASSNPSASTRWGIAHGYRSGRLRSVTGSESAIGAQSPTHPGARGVPHTDYRYFVTGNMSSLQLGSVASNGSQRAPVPLISSSASALGALSTARPDAALPTARLATALPAVRLATARPAAADSTTEAAARAAPGEDSASGDTQIVMGRGAPPGGEGCCSCLTFFGRRRTQIAPAPNPDDGTNNAPGMP